MQPLLPPIRPNDTGPQVVNLQDALFFLIEHQVIHSNDPPNHPTADELTALVQTAREEQRNAQFGEATAAIVRHFQIQQGLGDRLRRGINDTTAARLNELLTSLGALNEPTGYVVFGAVRDRDSKPVAGVTVRAYHRDATGETVLGEAVTTAAGDYRIEFPEASFRQTAAEQEGLTLLVRVFGAHDEQIGQSSIVANAGREIRLDIMLGAGDRVVRGTVVDADGNPMPRLTVRAFDRDLRQEQWLGATHTETRGTYLINYSLEQLRNPEKGAANLVIKAFSTDSAQLAASPVLFNAPPVAEIDVTIPAEVQQPPTLFEKIGRALEPVLAGLPVEELEEDEHHQDVSFLAGETGVDKNDLARFALAHRLAQEHLPPEFWFALLGGSFYEFTEQQSLQAQLTTILAALSTLDAFAVHKALTSSFNLKEIPEAFRDNVADWVEAFLQFSASQSVSEAAAPTFVKLALQDAGISEAEKQEKFARLFNEYKAITPELLAALAQDPSFTTTEVDDLRTSFQLRDLTQGDFSVVHMLKDVFGVRQPEHIRTLAKKSESELVAVVTAQHAAGEITLPIDVSPIVGEVKFPAAEVYGKTLARQFREAFPTTAYAGGLERALQNGGAHGLRHAEALRQFLGIHERFELLNTSVDDFFKNHLHPDAQALAENEDFRHEVKAVQRVFKLAPGFEATDALLADDLHSAQQIYRLGASAFVRRYGARPGFTPETARLAWNRAADTHAAVLTIVADLKSLEAEAMPLALQNGNAALATFPNWNNLFKTGDLCECQHCNSVLSPAAYFADLLLFLKDRDARAPENPGDPIPTVKDILFSRRPDLGYIELNCDNALVPLPYIDVVCEVLEDVIAAGENDRELLGFTFMPPDPVAAKAAVATFFAAADISLGADFSLSQVDAEDPYLWVVHSAGGTYLLKKKTTGDFFAEILRNTKASAAELRAYPQYVNPKAYDKLRQGQYPMTLPFDLFAEEVRTAFQKANLQRWDLMRTLRGATEPYNPTNGEIAAEYFGISVSAAPADDSGEESLPDEKRLILEADTTVAGQQTIWGGTGTGWLEKVGNVTNFLHKTRLEYNELLALLDLPFINPTGNITIQHSDSSCDTDQKDIQGLNAPTLDRIHRFLRLWRKLNGWKMWELDLVIRHPRIGNGILDESFLISLFYFSEVRKKLGGTTTVERVCALFGDLNTETRFTTLHAKREDALYQNLFLNTRLINPLDPAFQLDPGTDDLPAGETITAHHQVILAALGIQEADLILLKALTKASDGLAYITDDLTLANLSFLWRHSWLSKLLKFAAAEWKLVLKLYQRDILGFATPKAALDFLEMVEHVKATGFTPDELNWLLAADLSAAAAVTESDAARFLSGLRKELQAVQTENDPAQYDFLTVTPPTDVESLTALLTSLLQKLHRDETSTQFFLATLRDEVTQEVVIVDPAWPAGFAFPEVIKSAGRIYVHYSAEPVTTTLGFTGLMTATARATLLTHPSLSEITGIDAYQEAIEAFFTQPRLALKFFEPVFTALLAYLPEAVDFNTSLDAALALKISYDAEQRLLRCAGILSADEKAALDALSADTDYRDAVQSLFDQPLKGSFPPATLWLQDADLRLPLRDPDVPANDNLAPNLATAATEALTYLSKTLSEQAVVQQVSTQLGLTEALTRRLLTHYAVLPDIDGRPGFVTLLAHLTGAFAATTDVVDYPTLNPDGTVDDTVDDDEILKTTFDGWRWANRLATIATKWRIPLPDLDQIIALTAGAQLLDFRTLPLDDTRPIAALDRFLRTNRLLRLRDSLPETEITLLAVLENLHAGAYPTVADFAADVERLNEAWLAVDVEALTAALDLTYPAAYLLAETWERLRRVFYFLDKLNASAGTVQSFAAAAMDDTHAQTLKDLLRTKFGVDTWLALSTDIQDVLRERKRDALTAYLLTQPKPDDAPSGKWENTNDLYAYYLLDVEMGSCQLTSRLVQASGSVQLFVQRCFMGLEPDVVVTADGVDGDSAWRWWEWMSKYRVWEANRKVFLWPENWIEPELKLDRSPFFKDLENELLQNDINQYTVETAFLNYLEKLDGVAQLEIAGFYQEDDGDNTIIHVFGRTTGAEPHLYYYRRYDYRQWTPWEKVELDIQGDFLIPAVVNKRLFLFWPVFTEVPDEAGNSTITVPKVDPDTETEFSPQKTMKKLRLQMAVSDYRQGKWTPKKISQDADESEAYDVGYLRRHFHFFAIDLSAVDGRFGIKYECHIGRNSKTDDDIWLVAAFELSGCKGVPELATDLPGYFAHAIQPETASTGKNTVFLKWEELGLYSPRSDAPKNDFTLKNVFSLQSDNLHLKRVLKQTPWLFKMLPPWHLSYFDALWFDGLFKDGPNSDVLVPTGAWLPFFYNDKKRTFFVLPSFRRRREDPLTTPGGLIRNYYPEIKTAFSQQEDSDEGQVQIWVNSSLFSALLEAEREQVEENLHEAFPEEPPPPYTDEQIKNLAQRWYMRSFHYDLGLESLKLFQFRQFHFKNFYHPLVCDFAQLVYNPLQGIPALMSRETQLQNTGFSFSQSYQPTEWVVEPGTQEFYPQEVVDFTPDGAYAPYNWELFFHAPLLIANALSKNQRFEEAREWYHFIFNPLGVESSMPGGSPMSKYWITKPFFKTTDTQYIQQRIDNILRMLSGDTDVPGFSAQAQRDLEAQVLDWRTNPFEPHRIANYRTVAYQKTVVMKYMDNLIAWGDYLFRQDSMESINEATQLYILAAEILGPRPQNIPPQAKPPVESFNELETQLDDFSNAMVEVENLIPPLPGNGPAGADPAPPPMLYFCIPHNDKLLSYWDTVADRLYKIRHCMNIEGVVRQLALFEPPIDPGALVKAVAGGMDISSALADLNAPLPLYRFNVLLQKANEVCNDVKALGSALLAALEKKDAEALGLLRQSQEIRVLEAVKAVREQQVEEAKENLEGLKKSKTVIQTRRDYYRSIEKIIPGEQLSLDKQESAFDHQNQAQGINIAASILGYYPNVTIGISGFGGSPEVSAQWGTGNIISALQAAAGSEMQLSNAASFEAGRASTSAGYDRRFDDWKLQERLADKELEQIDKQIDTATLRVDMAESELDNHVMQIDNARATDAFMRSKYTNEALYQWQVGQISGVYFQNYKLAYDLAKRAERCFRFELGLQDSSYINFGYWDSLKKGLLCGEKLQYDLRRLETAYLDQNRREFELTKHVSLALLDPLALVMLRETGQCFFSLPEEIFDLDYPGHYFRRMKSVSLTLPGVVGPYTTVSCTLRLLKNSIRINTANGNDVYPRNTDDLGLPADDDRFIENNIPVRAIAASSAQNDSGVFELSFRDERYLPFEGAGVISQWSLALFSDPANPDFGKPLRQFDYNSMADAILHVKYTAREDAGTFKNGAITHLRDYFAKAGTTPSVRMFNLRQQFPSQWHRFLNPATPEDGNVFELDMSPSLFPIRDQAKTLKVNMIWLLARSADPNTTSYKVVMTPPLLEPPPDESNTISLTSGSQYGSLFFGQKDVAAAVIAIGPTASPVKWQLNMTRSGSENPQGNLVEDVFLVLGYEWE